MEKINSPNVNYNPTTKVPRVSLTFSVTYIGGTARKYVGNLEVFSMQQMHSLTRVSYSVQILNSTTVLNTLSLVD